MPDSQIFKVSLPRSSAMQFGGVVTLLTLLNRPLTAAYLSMKCASCPPNS